MHTRSKSESWKQYCDHLVDLEALYHLVRKVMSCTEIGGSTFEALLPGLFGTTVLCGVLGGIRGYIFPGILIKNITIMEAKNNVISIKHITLIKNKL